MTRPHLSVPLQLTALLVCVAGLLLGACGSPVEPQVNSGSAEDPVVSSQYCQAVETVLIAQPSAALGDEDIATSMKFYADSVERLAELSTPDDAAVLRELADAARLVGADPGDRAQAQRLGVMVTPAAAITLRASQGCGILG